MIYDMVIVGSGCAGLAGAMYAGRLGMKVLVLGELRGGTITTTHLVENYPGFIKLSGHELAKKLEELDSLLQQPLIERDISPVAIDPYLPTAIIFVNTPSVAMHTFLSIQRLFPNQFKNYVFLCAGAIDVESFSGQAELEAMQTKANHLLDYLVKFCYQHELAAEGYVAFGTDTINELKKLADTVGDKYPNAIFFASQLIFSRENMITRILHNQAPLILQHHLHFQGKKLMIIPMRI